MRRKRQNIIENNLRREKVNRQARKAEANIRDIVFKAVHEVVDKAAVIAAEDLTAPMSGGKFAKDTNRRLAVWTKGVIAEALETVSCLHGPSAYGWDCSTRTPVADLVVHQRSMVDP